jgi:lysozyme family protein
MPTVKLTAALRTEYEGLFNSCLINPAKAATVLKLVNSLVTNKARYATVERTSGVPWFAVAAIHNMEASQNFKCHLHNGDPLTARTVHVPKGRPITGNPPFTWEASAADALACQKLNGSSDWSLAGTLYNLEGYNGWGYRTRHPEVLTPYLWSYSNHYTSGKFVADGTWSDTAVSQQCGAAVLLRRMAELGQMEFDDQPAPDDDAPPLVPAYSTKTPKDAATLAQVKDLQRWLNTHPGIFVKVDGGPGPLTSDAYRKVTGSYLPGDPRGGK